MLNAHDHARLVELLDRPADQLTALERGEVRALVGNVSPPPLPTSAFERGEARAARAGPPASDLADLTIDS